MSLSKFYGERLSFVSISFYVLSLLFWSCHLSEFTLVRPHLYIIDYFSLICICDLSNRKFWFDLLVCGHLVSSNATIKRYHAIFLNCEAYNGNKRGQYPVTQYFNCEGRIALKICKACERRKIQV